MPYEVKLEYRGEDQRVAGAAIYEVHAIHVTTTANKRKFTHRELEVGGVSLSFRPLNINHNPARELPWPENTTLNMGYKPESQAVVGRIRIADKGIQAMIETGKIKKVSIEQIPTKGEECNHIFCEQRGVAFIGLALLEIEVPPGDSNAEIKGRLGFESVKVEKLLESEYTLKECLISDAQRECKDCNDDVACHDCKHKLESGDACVSNAIAEVMSTHPDWDRDKVIAVAISKCGVNNSKAEAWGWHSRIIEKFVDQLPN